MTYLYEIFNLLHLRHQRIIKHFLSSHMISAAFDGEKKNNNNILRALKTNEDEQKKIKTKLQKETEQKNRIGFFCMLLL